MRTITGPKNVAGWAAALGGLGVADHIAPVVDLVVRDVQVAAWRREVGAEVIPTHLPPERSRTRIGAGKGKRYAMAKDPFVSSTL